MHVNRREQPTPPPLSKPRNPAALGKHFGPRHPLAAGARRRCVEQCHTPPGRAVCGRCWEQAIRDDERFAVECGLPREVVADRTLVDEIALDRACAGERVRLTRSELRAAVARLAATGLCCSQIAGRLGRNHTTVSRILSVLTAQEVAA